jgi:glutamate:GABA antiporter
MALRRVLGFWDLAIFYTLTCFSLRWIATAAEAGPGSLTIWVLAALGFFVPLVAAVLELSARYPEEGGLYVWTRQAFGEFHGFLAGFLYWASNLPFFPGLLYFTAANALFVAGNRGAALEESRSYFIAFSVTALLVAAVLNVLGLSYGRWLHAFASIATWVPALLLIGCGVAAALRFGSQTSFTPASLLPSASLKDMLFWSTIAFAFGGVESVSCMGDEIRDPRRNVPRALLLSGALMAAAYVAATAAVLAALPRSEVSGLTGITKAILAASHKVGLPLAGPVAAILITLAGVGVTSAWLATTARLPFVGGLDRLLPPAFGKLHPRWGTPHVSILTQSALSIVFVLFSQAGTGVKGAYDVLVSMTVVTYFVPYLYLFAAMIRLQREESPPGTSRTPGGRPVAIALAALGFATTTISIVLAFLPAEGEANKPLAVLKITVASVALLGAGVWLFVSGRRRRAQATADGRDGREVAGAPSPTPRDP